MKRIVWTLATASMVGLSLSPAVSWSADLTEGNTANDTAPEAGPAANRQTAEEPPLLQEVLVTAQRKTESVQKVPISMTVVSEHQLEALNLTRVDSIQLITPGLTFDGGFNYAQNYIRGIGTNFPNVGLEGAVATYIDGAYLQRSLGELSDMVDVSRVEVLKGAQGSLYGRNASGGAILLTTADPTNENSLRVAGEYGRFDHWLGEVIGNARLSDTLSVRVAARESDDNGYITNLFDGRKFGWVRNEVLRGKLRWAPNENFEAVATVEHRAAVDGNNALTERAAAPLCLACSIPGSGAAPVAGFFDTDNDTSSPYHTQVNTTNLRLKYDTGPISFSSTTAYRRDGSTVITDQDYTSVPLFIFEAHTGGKVFTEELQASIKTDGPFSALVGASYLHDNAYYDALLSGESFAPLFTALGENPIGHDSVSTKSIAGYGELYWKPISRLTLTLGGRYTHDTRRLDGTANLAANLALAPPGSAATFAEDVSFNKFTPRVVVAYDLDSVNLYASWNKGYKAGGFTTPAFSAPAIVKPENVDSYELGAKFVSDDRRLRANAATFYYMFKDIQVSIVDIASGGQRIENAAKARGYGLELDGNFAATNWLTLFGGLSLLETKYLTYPNGSVSVPTATGLVAGSEDLSGDPLIHAPKATEFLGWDLHAPIAPNWTGNLNAVARHSSSYDFYPGRSGPLGNDYQRPITVANLTASVGPDSELYSIGVYVNNLTDQRYYIQRSTSQPFGVFDQVAAPRTYGVRVVAKF